MSRQLVLQARQRLLAEVPKRDDLKPATNVVVHKFAEAGIEVTPNFNYASNLYPDIGFFYLPGAGRDLGDRWNIHPGQQEGHMMEISVSMDGSRSNELYRLAQEGQDLTDAKKAVQAVAKLLAKTGIKFKPGKPNPHSPIDKALGGSPRFIGVVDITEEAPDSDPKSKPLWGIAVKDTEGKIHVWTTTPHSRGPWTYYEAEHNIRDLRQHLEYDDEYKRADYFKVVKAPKEKA